MPKEARPSRAGPSARKQYERGVFSRKNKRDGLTYYFIRFSLPDGRRRKEKAGLSKKAARELLINRKSEILNGTYVDPDQLEQDRGPTFKEFGERFLRDYTGKRGSDHYPGIVKLLTEYFGQQRIREITRADLDRFASDRRRGAVPQVKGKRKRRAVGDSTLRKNLIGVGTIFKMARRWRVQESNPAEDLVKPADPQHRTRYLSREEWQRLDATAPPWLKPLLRMAVATGMRLKEVVGLTWSNVDRQAGIIHVAEDTKTGTRAIPANQTVYKVLDGQVRHLRCAFVFVDPEGQPYTSKKARLRVSKATIAAMKAASISDASFQTLRHTAASMMVQSGVPLYEVQKILGHSTSKLTERYAHLQPDHLRNAVRTIDVALGVGPISAPSSQTEPDHQKAVAVDPMVVVGSGECARSSGDRATAF